MKSEVQKIQEWLNADYFQVGAFIADHAGQRVLLGKGGKTTLHTGEFEPSATAFYLKDFYEDRYYLYSPEEILQCDLKDLQEATREFGEAPLVVTHEENEDHHYPDDFLKLKSSWSHHLRKVVLISRESFQVENHKQARMKFFARALHFGAGLPYGLWNQEYGIVGSTPELLFATSGKDLHTFALAGTAKAGLEEELLSSAKDRLEHDLVIQDIMEKLKPFAYDIERGETGIETFRDIIHLKTDIKGTLLEKASLRALTSLMSPTAALGGYPKEASLAFLKETIYYKHHPERFFGSALGVVSPNLSQFLVMIRNIQWNTENFFIESGGGVLPKSDLDKEMAEFRLKRNIIKKRYL